MKNAFIIFFTLVSFIIEAQSFQSIKVSFIPMFNNQLLELDKSLNQDNHTISKLKFYISNIKFLDGDQLVWSESESYHLIDMEDIESMQLLLDIPDNVDVSSLNFDLGVDSLSNVSGAMSGDLDPMHGMYWAWQSGYINVKIEGKSDRCPARKNKFQYHLGGFLAPNVSLQKVSLKLNHTEDIDVTIDVDKLFETIDISKTYEIMSPRPEAVYMSHKIASLFEIRK